MRRGSSKTPDPQSGPYSSHTCRVLMLGVGVIRTSQNSILPESQEYVGTLTEISGFHLSEDYLDPKSM